MKPNPKPKLYAPVDGQYSLIVNGRRQIITHKSGEPLKGIPEFTEARASNGRRIGK